MFWKKIFLDKVISFFLVVFIAFSFICYGTVFGFAKNEIEIVLKIGNPLMMVNGNETKIDSDNTSPLILNERTLVPIRAIIEAMGGAVIWDQYAQMITLDYEKNEIKLIIGSNTAYLNDEIKELDCAPAIINNRTMLPIRFIAECFDFSVDWIQESQTIIISKNDAIYYNKEPLLERKTDGGLVKIFNQIICIGDSLTSGVIERPKKQDDGTYKNVATTVTAKSYPTKMKEILGIDVNNLGIGGHIASNDSEKQLAESKTVYSWYYKSHELNMWKNLKSIDDSACIIALGSNDISRFGSFTGNIGTDVNITENEITVLDNTTSVGGYCEIVNAVLNLNDKTSIFCVTLPNTRSNLQKRIEMNDKIREIVDTYRDIGVKIYLIDLEKFGVKTDEVQKWKDIYYTGGHLNEEGYQWLAETYMTYIDFIIQNNEDDFKELLNKHGYK